MGRGLKVWLNGEFLDADKAFVPVSDRGFLYSDGIFTTFRLSGGKVFLAERHLQRLKNSASFLGLPAPPPEVFEAAGELAARNGHGEGAGRITLTRGPLPVGPRPGPSPSPTVLITTRPLPPDLEERKEKGVSGRTLPWPSRAEGLPLQSHKTLAYLPSVLALGLVEEGAEPVLETAGGYLCEGATSNLFWYDGMVIRTPSLTSGCLPGVARELVLELAREAGFGVEEGLFSRKYLFYAREAFLTNSVAGIMPLVEVDGSPVGSGKPGPVFSALSGRWNEAVSACAVGARG